MKLTDFFFVLFILFYFIFSRQFQPEMKWRIFFLIFFIRCNAISAWDETKRFIFHLFLFFFLMRKTFFVIKELEGKAFLAQEFLLHFFFYPSTNCISLLRWCMTDKSKRLFIQSSFGNICTRSIWEKNINSTNLQQLCKLDSQRFA